VLWRRNNWLTFYTPKPIPGLADPFSEKERHACPPPQVVLRGVVCGQGEIGVLLSDKILSFSLSLSSRPRSRDLSLRREETIPPTPPWLV